MTTIKIYGYLSEIFGPVVKINVGNISFVIDAIDSVKQGFRKEIKKLSDQGLNYSVQIDQKDKKIIHIIPLIVGFGGAWKYVLGGLLILVGAVLLLTGVVPIIGNFLGSMAINLGLQLIFGKPKENVPQNPYEPPKEISLGGSSSPSAVGSKSYILNNEDNLATQGSIIPIGYGRFRLGSKVINVTFKSFPTNINLSNEIDNIANPLELNGNFLTNIS
jgi:predicted phage tail protein